MNLLEREVIKIIEENKTEYNGTVMYEMKMFVNDYGHEHIVDVILLEEDYKMIKEKGYYIC